MSFMYSATLYFLAGVGLYSVVREWRIIRHMVRKCAEKKRAREEKR